MSRNRASRRRFLKLAAASVAVVAAGALGLYTVSNVPENSRENSTTASQRSASSSFTVSSSAQQNIPFAVRDLSKQINPYWGDLQDFVGGKIDINSLKAGSDTYWRLTTNAETLRKAIKEYNAQNSETVGQARRLDQIALGGLYVYSWTSRMLEDDVNTARVDVGVGGLKETITSSIADKNLGVIRYPVGELARQLYEELYPDQIYSENVGKILTDIGTEHLISPRNRPWLKYLRDSVRGSGLKQLMESYNPESPTLSDYKDMTEEQLALVGLNILLHKTDDSNKEYVRTAIENAMRRNSLLGNIASRVMTLIDERIAGLQNGYSQHTDSVYSELPSNHTGLNDYDFGLALMRTPTFLSVRNSLSQIFPGHTGYYPTDDGYAILSRIFCLVSAHAGRDSYMMGHTSDINNEPSPVLDSIVKFGEQYYFTSFWGINPKGPDLPDYYGLSDPNFGYTGFRKYTFFIVSKSLFGTINAIPVFVYNPEKGIVIS